jgi:hypothetical protein
VRTVPVAVDARTLRIKRVVNGIGTPAKFVVRG